MLHRVRSRLVKGRTNLICQMRSYCLEHGVAIRQGAGVFKLDIVRAIDNPENDLTERARVVLRELQADLLRLEERILSVFTEIKNIADRDETAHLLMTIPGVGHSARLPFWHPSVTRRASRKHETWLHGWALCRGNIRQEGNRPCSALQSEEVAISERF